MLSLHLEYFPEKEFFEKSVRSLPSSANVEQQQDVVLGRVHKVPSRHTHDRKLPIDV